MWSVHELLPTQGMGNKSRTSCYWFAIGFILHHVSRASHTASNSVPFPSEQKVSMVKSCTVGNFDQDILFGVAFLLNRCAKMHLIIAKPLWSWWFSATSLRIDPRQTCGFNYNLQDFFCQQKMKKIPLLCNRLFSWSSAFFNTNAVCTIMYHGHRSNPARVICRHVMHYTLRSWTFSVAYAGD